VRNTKTLEKQSEMTKLEAIEKQAPALPDQQIALTQPLDGDAPGMSPDSLATICEWQSTRRAT
jgi:hypothetical protein